MMLEKASKHHRSTEFPSLLSRKPANDTNAANRLPNSTPAWLKGGGPIEVPKANAVAGRSTFLSHKLPAVARVRSQTYDEATRRNVRSNPIPDNKPSHYHLTVPRRKSNSAPSPIAGRKNITRATNHDRQRGTARPAFPQINLSRAGDTSSQFQSKVDGNSKRWASSWADARAHHETSPRPSDTSVSNSTRTSPSRSNQSSPSKQTSPRPYQKQQQHSSNPRSRANSDRTQTASTVANRNGVSRTRSLPQMSASQNSVASEANDTKRPEFKRRNTSYGAKDQLIQGPIADAYATSAVHVNTLRTGGFVDYEVVGETAFSKPTKKQLEKPGKFRDRSNSQASVTSTPRRGVSFRPIPKNKKPVMITKKARKQEKGLNSVYDNKTYKVQRKAWILKKMETREKVAIEEYNKHLEETNRKCRESFVNQREQLKKVRDNFDAEQVQRFKRQYVSWKSVESERLKGTRETYGLPDNIYDDRYDRTLKDVKVATTGKKKTFKQYASWIKNIKRFESMLNPSILGNPEVMKNQNPTIVEGIDTVELTNKQDPKSAKKKKPVKVRNVIGSAKRLLSANDQDDDELGDLDLSFRSENKREATRRISMISGMSSLSLSDDDDDDDDDLFS